jgi:hypothetical protein
MGRNLRHLKDLRQRGWLATAATGSPVARQLFVNFPARVA